MINAKKIIEDKSVLFALTEPKLHFVKASENTDEYFKVWTKEPTWLEVDKAMNSMMKLNVKTQDMDIDSDIW